MSLQTPLARAKGAGAAKEGVQHWWHQRLTALALVPLTLWLAFSAALMSTADYATVVHWLGHPLNGGLMMLALAVGFYHGTLGVQEVILDYVASEWKKTTLLLVVQFAAVALALGAILSVLLIMLEG